MKKLLFVAVAVILCISLLAGCDTANDSSTDNSQKETTTPEASEESNEPTTQTKTTQELLIEKYEEPVTITIVLGYRDSENPDTPDSVTPETSTAVKRFKEDLNIDLQYAWVVNNDQFAEKFAAELAAGNLPDIMYLSPNQFEDLYSQGGLADLTETYNLYANDSIKSIVDYDGQLINSGIRDEKLYGLPMSYYAGQVTSQTYYDMNALKEAGITSYDQLPTTIEEFEALCDLLLTMDLDGNGKTGDPVLPGNKYYIDAGLADFSPIFHAYESWASGWYDDGNGNLVYAGIQQELKDSLTKLNEWYNKGYFAKDFAAQDVWAADASVVTDIVSGKYAIVFGSWWIPNWPLNSNKANNPDADWVVGPVLTAKGGQPKIMVPRYPVNNFVAVSKYCEYPEAVFKMMNWSIEYGKLTNDPSWQENATEEEILEKNSEVYIWLPYRVSSPTTLIDNYRFISTKREAGSTEITPEEAPNNIGFWGVWSVYLDYANGVEISPSKWGLNLSRIAPNGGVAKMYELFTTARKQYDEVYVTTPTMITNQGEMDRYRDSTILSMIMGETPISDFDKYVIEWKALGGDAISKEVNEWYKNK